MRTKRFLCFILVFITVTNLLPIASYAAENWLWPVNGYYNISSGYDEPRSSKLHKGIDIDESYVGNITGKPVMASKSGTATVYWGYNDGAGNYVVIDHGDGYVSRYLHLDSIAISNGSVIRGQTIGYVGNTGYSTGPHLHFDIKHNGTYINNMPVNTDNRHTYNLNRAEITQNIRYDYGGSSSSEPPSNVTISADRYECNVGETVNLYYTIDNAWNSAYLVLYYNNENHFVYVNGSPGTVSYTFTEPGRYYIYTKGSNDYGTSDCNGIWITVNEIPPTNVTISAIDRTYCVGETITLNYTIDRAWNSSYIVLYYNNENHYVNFNGSPGSVEYTFTEPGHYYIYTKGSNDAGTSDCYGLHIDVNEPINLGDDFYAYIINPYSNMAVIHDNSNNAVIWERDNSYEQLWHFKRHNDGSYKITSVKSRLCLDVSNSSSETDAKVQVWEDNETTAQKWFIHSDGTNYRLRAMCTEYVLDIKNAIYTNGTELQTVNEHGDPAQRFYIQKSETFTITYNSNEKNSVITHQTKPNLIDIVLSTNIPIRDGYKFTGWNTKVDGTGITYNPGSVYKENNNLVLYAQWEELIPHTESTVTKSGAKLIVDTKVYNITAPYDIMIAGYKNNKFVTMKRVPHDEQNSPYTLEGDFDEIKVMVWDGLSTLKPLCDAEVIPYTEFITG